MSWTGGISADTVGLLVVKSRVHVGNGRLKGESEYPKCLSPGRWLRSLC